MRLILAPEDTDRLFAPMHLELVQEWNDELRPRFQRLFDDITKQLAGP